MKKETKKILLIYIPLYTAIAITSLIFLILKMYTLSYIFFIPCLFLFPIFLTFYKLPKKTNRHPMSLILSIILRYVLIFLAIFTPAIMWFYLPNGKDSVNALFLLVPFIEIFTDYLIIFVWFVFDNKGKLRKKNNEF